MKLSVGAVAEPGSTRANKTGTWRTFRPVFNADLCVGCGICSQFCPEGIIHEKNDKYATDYDYCKGCGICAAECPKGAIKMVLEVK
ncbi:MAG: 4Fe-4S binding protein [Methanocellales archaeon]|nr:4Fe-4S binding protein [Methanocellales archaeon]